MKKNKIKTNLLLWLITSFVSVFVIGACSTVTPTRANEAKSKDVSQYTDQLSFCQKITQDKITACNQQGGVLKKQGKAQCYACTISYADAGKVCRGSADCQGKCLNQGASLPLNVPNQTGKCASNNVIFGCRQTIEDGKATRAMLCVD